MIGTHTQLVGRLLQRIAEQPHVKRCELIELVREDTPLLDLMIVEDAVDRALARSDGYGPISDLLQQPEVSDIMVNGPGAVWIERASQMCQTAVIVDAEDIALLIERILNPLGLRVDRVSPMVDARLPDGSRVNIVVPPLAVEGPVVTIRRFSTKPVPLKEFGPQRVVELLHNFVDERASILVVGGTGTGKTTLLNGLGSYIAESDRVVVVEDTTELQLPGDHVVRLEARPDNSEGIGGITLRQLVKNALRMRPDRLVIGEVRGGEALDLLLALNTGHRGSLATCHANGPEAGLRRLETLCLLGGVDLPLLAIREQIGSAIDVVVHLVRTSDGTRTIQSVNSVAMHDVPTCAPLWVRDSQC